MEKQAVAYNSDSKNETVYVYDAQTIKMGKRIEKIS